MLTIDTIPLWINGKLKVENEKLKSFFIFHFPLSVFHLLFVLFMQLMAAAATAKLFKLKPVRRVLFVFCRYVVALFALSALQNNIISWHFFPRSELRVYA